MLLAWSFAETFLLDALEVPICKGCLFPSYPLSFSFRFDSPALRGVFLALARRASALQSYCCCTSTITGYMGTKP